MRAGKLFKDMGFTRIRHNTSLIYKCKNRYTECTVYFDLNIKTYFVSCTNIIYVDIDMRLHMAIHQQLRELNWIMD